MYSRLVNLGQHYITWGLLVSSRWDLWTHCSVYLQNTSKYYKYTLFRISQISNFQADKTLLFKFPNSFSEKRLFGWKRHFQYRTMIIYLNNCMFVLWEMHFEIWSGVPSLYMPDFLGTEMRSDKRSRTRRRRRRRGRMERCRRGRNFHHFLNTHVYRGTIIRAGLATGARSGVWSGPKNVFFGAISSEKFGKPCKLTSKQINSLQSSASMN